MRRVFGVLLVAGAWMLWAASACDAQSTPAADPAPCSVLPQPVPCGETPAAGSQPSATQKFPFPGEGSGVGASRSTLPGAAPLPGGVPPTNDGSAEPSGAASKPASGSAPGAATGTPPTGKKGLDGKFPFPGEEEKGTANGTPNAGSLSGTSSSSSSSSSSYGDGAAGGEPGSGSVNPQDTNPVNPQDNNPVNPQDNGIGGTPPRHLLHRVFPVRPQPQPQTADQREAEDLRVAHFYSQTGDVQGEYLRSQDAVKTVPDDPDAHFALAEAALKMKKWDEAIAEYKACLKLDPSDKEIKKAHKELRRLTP